MAEFPSWQQGVRRHYPALTGAVKADAAVLGGGLAGVITALMLQRRGLDVVLLEADSLGHGASFGCSGALTCQAPHVFQRIHDAHGLDTARTFAHLMQEAVHGVAQLAQPILSCRLTRRSVYLFAETWDDLPHLERLLALEARLGLPVSTACDAGGCPFPVELSAVMHNQYALHPLPFLLALAESAVHAGCRMYEHTPVMSAEGNSLRTPCGAVHADKVILCTGVPPDCRTETVLSLLEPRLYESRVLHVSAPLHTIQRSVHPDEPGLMPLPDGMLLTIDRGAFGTHQEENSRIIRDRTLRSVLPEAATADVIIRREVFSQDGLPLIGPADPRRSRVLMAGGFSAHGLTGAFLAAQTLTGMILGHAPAEYSLFLPFRRDRSKLSAVTQPVRHAARRKLRRWTHIRAPRCSHMGCPLRYHPGSRQWHCPCHGSSFDVFGQVLCAPAVSPAQLSPKDRPV